MSVTAIRPLVATYRLQLNKDFRLADVQRIAPYLRRLGISHVYSSPALRSRPGSTHGYDVVDPAELDPELGTEAEWRRVMGALHAEGIGVVLDIVPNHMGTGRDNPYWDDVLANGIASRYASWFDIDWEVPQRALRGRVLLPALGDRLEAVLARGEIRVAADGGALRVTYFEHSFPLDPATWPRVLAFALCSDPGAARADDPDMLELRRIVHALAALPPRTSRQRAAVARRQAQGPALVERLHALSTRSDVVRAAVDRAARELAEDEGGPARLRALLDAQAYALAFWRRAGEEINYRRFFDVNELVAVRAEHPDVFEPTHRRILGWVRDGSVDGLRVDHIDGLADPVAYLDRLRDAIDAVRPLGGTAAFPVFVEKILTPGERLREDWPADGTTGYEFLNQLEAIFLDPAGTVQVERDYRDLLNRRGTGVGFEELAVRCRLLVLGGAMRADVLRLARDFRPLARRGPATASLTPAELGDAIALLVACMPVYRTYIAGDGPVHPADRVVIEAALARAVERDDVSAAALRLIATTMLCPPADGADEAQRLRFTRRVQQTSGPAMAKGIEDTLLYRWFPIASRNEVGGDPGGPVDDAVAELHRANRVRAARWPHTLVATNTHDTKRSADARARLDVLSEIPGEWAACVARWRELNAPHRAKVRRRWEPAANTEYLLYQTLVAIWPAEGADARALAEVRERTRQYMEKAAREAKAETSWSDPDAEYEGVLRQFVDAVLRDGPDNEFLSDLARFVPRVARPGFWNSLSRVLVHLTAPGVPDVYQGNELWNFTLVDPDNRRPVDFALRGRLAAELEAAWGGDGVHAAAHLDRLLRAPEDGRIKMHVHLRALAERQAHAALFTSGSYTPLEAAGERAEHVFAFARADARDATLTVVSRLTTRLGAASGALPVGEAAWGDSVLPLPDAASGASWRCALSGARIRPRHGAGGVALRLADVFRSLPVALLLLDPGGPHETPRNGR